MGTNYYCETGRKLEVECDCGFTHIVNEKLHIGKSSWGWKFTLHSIPEKGLTSWKRWEMVLRESPRIFDEYGSDVKFGEMKRTILRRKRKLRKDEKEKVRRLAKKNMYSLDEGSWLFSSGNDGADGDYCMLEGDFS